MCSSGFQYLLPWEGGKGRERQASGLCLVKNKQVVLTESAERSPSKSARGRMFSNVSRIQPVLPLNFKIRFFTKKRLFFYQADT